MFEVMFFLPKTDGVDRGQAKAIDAMAPRVANALQRQLYKVGWRDKVGNEHVPEHDEHMF